MKLIKPKFKKVYYKWSMELLPFIIDSKEQ